MPARGFAVAPASGQPSRTGSWVAAVAAVVLLAARPAGGEPPAPSHRAPPDVEALLRRLDDLYRSGSSIARMEIAVTTPRSARSMRLRAWTRGEEKALVVVEAPPREAGTATLRDGQNLWNWLPRIARTIRVPPSMMLGSWMGTDFTNDDLVKESSLRRDFEARVERRSDDPPGWWLTLSVRPGITGRWARIDILVDDAGLPVEERHFDRKGRLARTLRFDEVKVLGGRRLPSRFTLVPEGLPGQRTELRYLELELDADVPDETFSLARLEKGR